jgi:hypothetical protein
MASISCRIALWNLQTFFLFIIFFLNLSFGQVGEKCLRQWLCVWMNKWATSLFWSTLFEYSFLIKKNIDISFRCKETYRKNVWRFHSAIRHEILAIWRHQWRWQAQNPSSFFCIDFMNF